MYLWFSERYLADRYVFTTVDMACSLLALKKRVAFSSIVHSKAQRCSSLHVVKESYLAMMGLQLLMQICLASDRYDPIALNIITVDRLQ